MKTNDLGGTAVEIPDDGKSDEERRSEERGYILRLWWQSLVHPIDGSDEYADPRRYGAVPTAEATQSYVLTMASLTRAGIIRGGDAG